MIKVVLALFMAVTMANAAGGCILVRHGDVGVTWQAYKTASKVGVSGNFTSVDYKGISDESVNFRGLLVGSKVTVDTKSVNSKSAERDAKLVAFFFGKMASEKIVAEIVDIKAHKTERGAPKEGIVTAKVTMNGVAKRVDMDYHFKDGHFKAEGKIDLADFSALGALASINKACYELHEGKTWADVTVGFTAEIKATLCAQ